MKSLICKIGLAFGLGLLAPVLALLYHYLSDIERPSVVRPATPAEQKQVTDGMTGWDKAFANHK
jgi:hypothetical protein